jgi:hypothetical protein
MRDFRIWGNEEGYKFDRFAHAVTTIDEPHRLIHDGMLFSASGRNASLANGANLDLLLVTPANARPHVQDAIFYAADSPCNVYLYEDTVTSNDGTVQTLRNRNRNSSNTAKAALSTGPTVTGVGTLLREVFIPDSGGGFGPWATAGGAQAGNFNSEWVLKPSTKYLFRFTNSSGGAVTVSWEILFYELSYEV